MSCLLHHDMICSYPCLRSLFFQIYRKMRTSESGIALKLITFWIITPQKDEKGIISMIQNSEINVHWVLLKYNTLLFRKPICWVDWKYAEGVTTFTFYSLWNCQLIWFFNIEFSVFIVNLLFNQSNKNQIYVWNATVLRDIYSFDDDI